MSGAFGLIWMLAIVEKSSIADTLVDITKITFNTSDSDLQTLVFHFSEKDWIDIGDINYKYNKILALNNNTYNIIILPEYEKHQNWQAELEWLNDNFMGNQGIPIMLL